MREMLWTCVEALVRLAPLSSLRTQGPITTALHCQTALELQPSHNCSLWLWVPDRARFARLSGTTASILTARFRLSFAISLALSEQRAQGRPGAGGTRSTVCNG